MSKKVQFNNPQCIINLLILIFWQKKRRINEHQKLEFTSKNKIKLKLQTVKSNKKKVKGYTVLILKSISEIDLLKG